MANLKLILRIYECTSGFKVNISKSCMAGVGVDEEVIASQGGCYWLQGGRLTFKIFEDVAWGESPVTFFLGPGGGKSS